MGDGQDRAFLERRSYGRLDLCVSDCVYRGSRLDICYRNAR
jgi:hypothetical protein